MIECDSALDAVGYLGRAAARRLATLCVSSSSCILPFRPRFLAFLATFPSVPAVLSQRPVHLTVAQTMTNKRSCATGDSGRARALNSRLQRLLVLRERFLMREKSA